MYFIFLSFICLTSKVKYSLLPGCREEQREGVMTHAEGTQCVLHTLQDPYMRGLWGLLLNTIDLLYRVGNSQTKREIMINNIINQLKFHKYGSFLFSS